MRRPDLRLGRGPYASRSDADVACRRPRHDHPMALQIPHQRPAYPAALPRRRSDHLQHPSRRCRTLRQQRSRCPASLAAAAHSQVKTRHHHLPIIEFLFFYFILFIYLFCLFWNCHMEMFSTRRWFMPDFLNIFCGKFECHDANGRKKKIVHGSVFFYTQFTRQCWHASFERIFLLS